MIKPKLNLGDKIILIQMDDDYDPVSPGTKGEVIGIEKEHWGNEGGEKIYVKWEDGRNLPILSDVDIWIHDKKKMNEDISDFITNRQNFPVLKNFDWSFLTNYLTKVRDSGIINMFGAAPLLYSGKDHIERYHGEGREDDESFNEVLELADEAKQKMIEGVVKYLNSKGNKWDISDANREVRKFSQKLLEFYIAMNS